MKRGHRGLACLIALVVLAALAGCGRHVVVEPETALRANDRAWTVKSEPRPVVVVVVDGGAPSP